MISHFFTRPFKYIFNCVILMMHFYKFAINAAISSGVMILFGLLISAMDEDASCAGTSSMTDSSADTGISSVTVDSSGKLTTSITD